LGCWSDLVQEVREHYPEYKEQLLVPIWDTGDKLLRLNVIRSLASDRDDEAKIFQRVVQRPNTQGMTGSYKPWCGSRRGVDSLWNKGGSQSCQPLDDAVRLFIVNVNIVMERIAGI